MIPLHAIKIKFISNLIKGSGWRNSSIDVYQVPTMCQTEIHRAAIFN